MMMTILLVHAKAETGRFAMQKVDSYRVFKKKKLSVYTTSFTIFYVLVLLTLET